ncbi:MAG: alpha/beta fold hydrolase [Rubrivivax sp.]|nr:alpha/beta fold hydrolase [Rubrivivax sp.]
MAGLLGARTLAHRAILRGLRAPRVPHSLSAADLPVAPGHAREVSVPGPRGRALFAWLVMPPSGGTPVPVVLALHGWGGNAAMMWPVVPPLHAAGWAVLLLDARCHGRSGDDSFTSMPRFAEDIAAGLAWLRRQPGIDAGRVALLGHSVGAAAALLHASRRADVQAVVSLSAFAHPTEVMRRFLSEKHVPYRVFGWYVLRHVQRVIGTPFDAIAPLRTIAHVRCPVLLVHGLLDTTVPFDDAIRLHAASTRAQLLPVAGDHDLRETFRPHAKTLVDFLTQALNDRTAGPATSTATAPGLPATENPVTRAAPASPKPP